MEVKAKSKHVRMSSRKVRLVVNVVRGLEVNKALDQLNFLKKLATEPVIKLIKSAIANAVNNYELDKDNLFIKEIRVDEGTTTHRWMPRAHGRATPIRKRASHIILTLGEIKDSGKKEAKKQKIEAPVKLGEKPKEDEGIKVKKDKKGEKPSELEKEKGKEIKDPRLEGRGGHARVEGGSGKGFMGKMFRRKSG